MPTDPSSPEPSDHEPSSSDPSSSPEPSDLPPAGEAPTTQAPPRDAPRRLLRSRDDRVLGGVCAGLARYFGIDPLIVRIGAVALAFVGGAAIIAYIAALLLVPEDDGTGRPVPGKPGRVATLIGAVAIVGAGVALLNGAWGPHFGWFVAPLVPLVLIVTVLAIAGQRLLANRGEARPTAARIAGAGLLLVASLAAALLGAAGAAWATAAGGGTVVAGVVIAIGVAMVVLALRRRRAAWLAVPALALAIPSGVVAAAGVDTEGGVGQRTYQPATIADVHGDTYRLGAGELVIDLRDLRWPQGTPLDVKVKVGTGHALVLVPRDVCVQSKTHVGAGYVNILGQESGGADVDDQRGTTSRATGPRLLLDAQMGIGAVEVRHRNPDGNYDFHNGRAPDTIPGALADVGCAGVRA